MLHLASIFISEILLFYSFCFAQERPDSTDLISKAWQAHGRNDIEATFKYTQECINLYKEEADKQQTSLKALPKEKTEIEAVKILNDVAVAYFIQAESFMRQGKTEEAKRIFQFIIDNYPYAQAWDPRGWYWQVAKVAQESIAKLEGKQIYSHPKKIKVSQIPTKITLYEPGEEIVDYTKYGEFKNIGTKDYQYIIKDQAGLIQAVGEGVYPNTLSARRNPSFKKVREENRLEGSHWDFLQSPDLEAAFFKWAFAPEPIPVRLFYTGLILEKSGLIKQAIKCYYAIVVHFPASYSWTYWRTPWYLGQAAISRIKFLLKKYPDIGYKLVDAYIKIINGFDHDIKNDIVVTNPGRFIKTEKLSPEEEATSVSYDMGIRKEVGKKIKLVQYNNGHWQLLVNNQPYFIQGITYAPTKVGQSPDEGTLSSWMYDDFNNNNKPDGPYDSFVDKNKNNLQDQDELPIGDFQLMKEMGINTIRVYHHPQKVNKEVLRDLYKNYGIRVIMGDFLGKYALGSGASWNPGTDYRNELHKKNMLESVLGMVREHKDEEYVLFWLLGNENVYGYACNADKYPEDFFQFANEVAKEIKKLDPERPVAICSGDVLYLDKFGQFCPDIDIFGTNAYRGEAGFGFLWREVRENADKPVFITEFGCPAYAEGYTSEEAEEFQAQYHYWSWQDIKENRAFANGEGNSLGGVIFEWLDEWWKAYEPSYHDFKPLWAGPFPDGFMHEEWLGICGQGDGKLSPFLRHLRRAYFVYKEMWNNK